MIIKRVNLAIIILLFAISILLSGSSYKQSFLVSPLTSELYALPESPPPNGHPFSGETVSGGTRPIFSSEIDNCPSTAHPLTVIAPPHASGASTSNTPTLWIYVPYTKDVISSIKLSLQDINETSVLGSTVLQASEQPGITSIAFPALPQQETPYRWYLTLSCQKESSLPDLTVYGIVWQSTPDSDFRWNGIWLDKFNTVISNYKGDKNNREHRTEWRGLLSFLNLEYLETANFI